MITYPKLGRVGRLGNHLFQIAATISCALKNEETYGFPRWEHEECFQLAGCFYDQLPDGPEYLEARFQFDPIPYSPNLSLYGFFQSERYFSDHKEHIRKLLMPHEVGPKIQAASVQIRRGDYMLLPDHHPLLPMDYYGAALELLRRKGVKEFVVFSDDLPWCRTQKWGPGVEVISDGVGQMEQFCRTLACTHHIMANSTFSWWTAWLDPDPEKVVIAPRRWFGPGYSHYDTRDLIPEGWLVL